MSNDNTDLQITIGGQITFRDYDVPPSEGPTRILHNLVVGHMLDAPVVVTVSNPEIAERIGQPDQKTLDVVSVTIQQGAVSGDRVTTFEEALAANNFSEEDAREARLMREALRAEIMG